MVKRSMEEEDGLPEELEEPCTSFHNSLGELEQSLKLLLNSRLEDTLENLDPLEQASLLLLNTYTLNSLFWTFLTTQGVSLSDHPIKAELERIQKTMAKLKEVQNKQKGKGATPKLRGANRFIRNALWSLEEKEREKRLNKNTADVTPKKLKLEHDTSNH